MNRYAWFFSVLVAVLFLPSLSFAQKKFSIHGYLSQAYAQTDELQYLGIPEEGTSDYRSMAIQFRMDYDKKNTFVVQLSHKRLGLSKLLDFSDEVELDWGFYQYNFNETMALKIGKVQTPSGIYNEIRDVGSLLPFYRAPLLVYADGQFRSETVDGAVFSHSLWQESNWSLDYDLFFGGWDVVQAGNVDAPELSRSRNSFGGQLWLNTPMEDLRFGFYWDHETQTRESAGGEMTTQNRQNWLASADFRYRRFVFQFEMRHLDIPPRGRFRGSYFYAGYTLGDRFQINAQVEDRELKIGIPSGATLVSDGDDRILGVNFQFAPQVILKLEHHSVTGEDFLERLPRNAFGVPLVEPEVKYFILSLSASF